MKNISKDIETEDYKRAYLIYGEEKFLVRNTKNKLLEAVVNEGDNMNFTKFAGKDSDPKKVIDLAETMPFFANYRVVLLEDTDWFKYASDDMADYIKDIPEETILIFVESEVDKRNKLYKKVKEFGYICECERLSNSDLTRWILVRFKKEGKNITKNNMDYLLNKLGNDMDNISSELDKLLAYTYGKDVIEKEDIDNICSTDITAKIFDMIDAIGNKNQKKALELYYDLIAVREAPLKILFMLSRQFNIMYQIKEMSMNNIPAGQMAKNMGMQNFIINKTMGQCKNFKLNTLKHAMGYCMKLEEAIKLGNMNDKMAVELVIVKYSM